MRTPRSAPTIAELTGLLRGVSFEPCVSCCAGVLPQVIDFFGIFVLWGSLTGFILCVKASILELQNVIACILERSSAEAGALEERGEGLPQQSTPLARS